jgi:hypothetical protein
MCIFLSLFPINMSSFRDPLLILHTQPLAQHLHKESIQMTEKWTNEW